MKNLIMSPLFGRLQPPWMGRDSASTISTSQSGQITDPPLHDDLLAFDFRSLGGKDVVWKDDLPGSRPVIVDFVHSSLHDGREMRYLYGIDARSGESDHMIEVVDAHPGEPEGSIEQTALFDWSSWLTLTFPHAHNNLKITYSYSLLPYSPTPYLSR